MTTLRGIGLTVGGCLLVLAAPTALAQSAQKQPAPIDPNAAPSVYNGRTNGPVVPSQGQLPPLFPDAVPGDSRLEHDQARLRNQDRQRQIVADTQKLVELANQLNAAVEKSNKDTLSMDVIRKADEIEKLAKSVREKMKGS
jgi:hypothetical protein